MKLTEPVYVENQDILIKLDDSRNVKALLAQGISPREATEALIVALKTVCDIQGEDWRGVLFSLGLRAYAKDLKGDDYDG